MKKHFFLFFGLLLLLNDASAATTIDDAAFGSIWEALAAWMQGSLGYIIALLGTIGTLFWFLLARTVGFEGSLGKQIFFGIIISFLAGGLVGLTQAMFSIGAGTFN